MMKNLFRCTLILAVLFLVVWSTGCTETKSTAEDTGHIQTDTPAEVSENEPGSDKAPSSQPTESQKLASSRVRFHGRNP